MILTNDQVEYLNNLLYKTTDVEDSFLLENNLIFKDNNNYKITNEGLALLVDHERGTERIYGLY